jgi:hypothetical protein
LTPPLQENTTLLARITGIVIRPRQTFEAVVTRPRPAGVLAVLTAVSFAATAAFIATDVGQVAVVDQWERTALAFGQRVDDERYGEMQELSRYRVPYAAATTVARGPVAAVAIAGALYAAFAMRGRRARFAQVLAVVAHAGVILALRDIVAAPINYVRESLASPVTLVQVFGTLDEASPVARLFALFDLFVVWWLVVLAIGLAVLYHARARAVAAGLLAAYAGLALFLAGTMAVLGNR